MGALNTAVAPSVVALLARCFSARRAAETAGAR